MYKKRTLSLTSANNFQYIQNSAITIQHTPVKLIHNYINQNENVVDFAWLQDCFYQ